MFSCTFVVFVATWKSDKIPIRGFTSDSYLKKSEIFGVKVRFNFLLLEITSTVNVIKPYLKIPKPQVCSLSGQNKPEKYFKLADSWRKPRKLTSFSAFQRVFVSISKMDFRINPPADTKDPECNCCPSSN